MNSQYILCLWWSLEYSAVQLREQIDFCIYITGPGLKSPEERTIDYLEEVAIECTRGIINKKIPLRKEKGTMQSKKLYLKLFICFPL